MRNEALVLEYLPNARILAVRFWKCSPIPYDLDDYVGVAQLALVKSGVRFVHADQGAGVPEHAHFWVYAKRRITGALRDAVAAYITRQKDAPVVVTAGLDLELFHLYIREGHEQYEIDRAIAARVVVEKAIAVLAPGSMRRKIIELLLAGLEPVAIQEQLGITKNNYNQTRHQAVLQMRVACCARGVMNNDGMGG